MNSIVDMIIIVHMMEKADMVALEDTVVMAALVDTDMEYMDMA